MKMVQETKTSGQMLCDYMYNPESTTTYDDIVKQVDKEKFQKSPWKYILNKIWELL